MGKFLTKSLSLLFLLSISVFTSCSSDVDNIGSIRTEDFSITMEENPNPNQVIGTVKGYNIQESISFSIIEQNPEGAFSINSTSGLLKVADASVFKFNANPIITGTIRVSDGIDIRNSFVTITLKREVIAKKIYQGNVTLKTPQEVIDFGLQRYTDIIGHLYIGGDDENLSNITDLGPLYTLKQVNDNLVIAYNGALITTSGLDNITSIGRDLTFTENPVLERIEGMNNITSILGSLHFMNNWKLFDLEGIRQISSIGEDLFIFENPKILNLDWLSNLTSINTGLQIIGNQNIQNIDGLSNLNNITNGNINIGRNPSLETLDGLENLTATINSLSIVDNTSLKNIDGIHNITPTKNVGIAENPLITNLNGLSAVKNVINMSVDINYSLTNLSGLNDLQSVSGFLKIKDNPRLKNLDALNDLIHVGQELSITSNSTLKDFCVLTNIIINGNVGVFITNNNGYNPTTQHVIDGKCSI